jgi:catechol 2,3-dioxygenase
LRDWLEAQQFYYKVAGFHEVYRQPDNKASFVSNGNAYHDLTLADVSSPWNAKKQPAGLNHIAFELETEVDLVAGYRRALEAGVKFTMTMDHDVAHSVYLNDPDGNAVEIYADVVKDWRSQRHGVVTKAKPKYIPGDTSPPNTEKNYPQNPDIDIVPDAMFQSRKCSHVGIVAGNYPEMFAFYRDSVGLEPYYGDANTSFAILAGTHSMGVVTLLRERSGMQRGMHHVGLEVWDESNLDRGVVAATKAGLQIERQIEHPARRIVCIKDPTGIRLQFYVNRDWRPEVIATVPEEIAPYLL